MANLTALAISASINANLQGLQQGLAQGRTMLTNFGAGISPAGITSFVNNVSSQLATVGARLSGIGSALTDTFTRRVHDAVDAASDLSESVSKTEVVFGKSAEMVKKFSETSATGMGLSQQKALEAAGTFGNLFTSLKIGQQPAAEMSTNLVKLASDLASFNNINPTDALDKLRAGITGEAEPLKSLGIAMNETALKAKMLEMGMKPVGKEFTEQQKIAGRYAIILEQSKNAQGDFARTSEGAANAQRIFSAQLENLSAQFGQAFLPILTQGIQFLSGLVQKFQELPSGVQTAITVFVGIGAALGPVLLVFGQIASAISAALPIITAIGSALASLNPIVLAVVAAVAALVFAWKNNLGGIREAVTELASDLKAIFDKIVAFVKAHIEDFKTIWEGLKTVFSGVVSFIGNTLSALIDVIRAIFKVIQGDWSGAWELLKSAGVKIVAGIVDLVAGLFSGLVTILEGIWGLIRGGVEAAWNAIANFFTTTIPNMLAAVVGWFASLPGKILGFLQSLPSLIGQLFSSIASTAVSLVGQLVEGVSNFFSQLPGRISSFVSSAWEFVKSTFNAGVNFAISAASRLVSGAVEFIGKLPGLISNIFNNIFDFFASLPSLLFNKAISIGASIWNGFKEGLGIHSPSGPEKNIKAMADGMQLIMEQAKPKLSKAADELGKAIDQAISRYLDGIGVKVSTTINEVSRLSPEWRKRITEVVRDSEKAAEDLRRIGLVIAFFPEKARESFDKLVAKAKELRETIVPVNDAIGASSNRLSERIAQSAAQQQISHQLIQDAYKLDQATAELSAQAQVEAAETAAKGVHDALIEQYEDLSKQLPDSLNKIVDGILNSSGRLGDALLQLGVKVKGFIGDALGVIDAMPGRIGDATRKVVSTIDQWTTFIDRILGLLNKLNSNIPASIGDIAGKVAGIFKKSSKTVLDTSTATQDQIQKAAKAASQETEGLAKSTGESTSGIAKAFGVATSAVGAFATGLSTAAATGSKALGSIMGAAQGALSGFATGGPIGAIIGGVGGLLGGLFGGKSAAQKQKEKLELDRLKQDVQKGAQEVMSAAFETMQKALETFDKLADFTKTPRSLIHKFFKQMEVVIADFIALAKIWSVSMLDQAKKFAESVGPILETIGVGVEAFDKLGGFTGVPDKAINLFGLALERAVELFIQIEERFKNKAERMARRFAERAKSVVEVIGEGVQAFAGLADYKGIPEGIFEAFLADLEFAVNRMSQIADEVDKRLMKQAERFSGRAITVVQLIKEGVESFKGINDYKAISVEIFDLFLANLKLAVVKMQEVVRQIDTEMLTMAQTFSSKSMSIFAAIKAGVEAFTALRDYKSIPKEALAAVIEDFKAAVALMSETLSLAVKGEDLAKAFRDAAVKIAQSLAEAGQALGGLAQQATAATVVAATVSAPVAASALTAQAAVSSNSSSTSTTYEQHIDNVTFTIQGADADTVEKIREALAGLQAATRKR